ncbi:HoxN/HupN/NixA family nickel/cobalt transporter [Kocuria sp. M1N1S27]|uniref:HoxN/HupN/NixA family nickel/cobalt transporter n=1 Tax=Kocuria kalidii TaxID=3376283 RepID=UPI0037AE6BE5
MGATVLGLHVAGWGAVFAWLLPAQAAAGANAGVLLGLAVGAYALGVRHAFDADHIAAIDNATRQFLTRGRTTVTTGFWFALGHSSVVVASVALLALGVETFTKGLAEEDSTLRQAAGIWGGTVSGLFLLTAGALNLPALRSLHRLRRTTGGGPVDEHQFHTDLNRRGVLHRVLHPLTRTVDRPVKMYPVGFLFGLGLDTAASISLFVLAGTLAPSLPWYAAMVLPVLFTAGMTAFDSADGLMMARIYSRATGDARRSLDYNIIVTGVSVVLAFLIGGTGLLSVAAELVQPTGGFLEAVTAVDLNFLGIAVIAFFALAWMIAAAARTDEPPGSPPAPWRTATATSGSPPSWTPRDARGQDRSALLRRDPRTTSKLTMHDERQGAR